MISEHTTHWLGYPVQLFDAERSEDGLKDYTRTIYRIALDWDSEVDFPTLLARFLDNPASSNTPALVIGQFHGDDPSASSEEVVRQLVAASSRLPKLQGLFLGDLVTEESEVSWIQQCDVSPLLAAFPNLEHLRVRGSEGLSLGPHPAHAKLKSLVIETGGLPPAVLAEVAAAQFPALEHLELWLGTPSYGGDATMEDLEPFLDGKLFPKLKHLGLRDSEITDEIAAALDGAGVMGQLESLDLSLGLLSDIGGQALLENLALKRLKALDLHHHYLSERMMAALQRVCPGVNLEDAQGSDTDEEDRFVAVSE